MFRLPENVAQAILNYLAKRPFEEVFGLINAIQTLDKEGKVKDEVENKNKTK